jgi:putative oxidoreductase
MKNVLPPLGRLLLSAIFLKTGIQSIFSFAVGQQSLESHGIPLAALFFAGSIFLRIAGGLSVLLGYKAKWGALALIIFLIPTTLIFHTQFPDSSQMTQFLKNIGILGGLLMVIYFGPGPVSIDTRSKL